MENLVKIVNYLHKCLLEMPSDLLPKEDECFEIVITAICNVLCNVAWAGGASKESFLENVEDIWNQKEEAEKEHTINEILN